MVLDARDRETVLKASQTANLLVQDLRELVNADDHLLGDAALDLLKQAVQVEQRLKRIEAITREKEKPA